jgi:SAM-dependent methyltransferase
MNKKIEFIVQGNRWCVDARDEADVSVFNEIFKLHEYRIADDVIRQAVYPIVDVGAHAGFFSMHARSLNKKVKIFAVEPEPENIRALEQHVRENNITGVTVVKAALGLSSGSGKLIVTPDSHNHRLALGFEDQKHWYLLRYCHLPICWHSTRLQKFRYLKWILKAGNMMCLQACLGRILQW